MKTCLVTESSSVLPHACPFFEQSWQCQLKAWLWSLSTLIMKFYQLCSSQCLSCDHWGAGSCCCHFRGGSVPGLSCLRLLLSPVSSTGCLFSCRPQSSRKTALLPPCWPQVLYSTAATQCRLQQWQEARDTLEKAVVWRPEGRSATLALALERVQVRLPLWVPGEVLWAQAEESKIRICRVFYVFGFSCLPTSLVTWWHSKQFLCDALPSFS